MAAPEPIDPIVDLDSIGDALPDLIEQAARAGRSLVVQRHGVRLAVIVPEPRAAERRQPISNEEAFAKLAKVRAKFADQTQEEIERETERAIREVRAEMRGEDHAPTR